LTSGGVTGLFASISTVIAVSAIVNAVKMKRRIDNDVMKVVTIKMLSLIRNESIMITPPAIKMALQKMSTKNRYEPLIEMMAEF